MNKELPLVEDTYLLQKFPGKGGWTYAEIPEVVQNKNNPFGWVKVKGSIDNYPLSQYKLMPMGNGKLFLPVKSAIRKKIGKEKGDYVHVILFVDHSKFTIPDEIMACFEHEIPVLLEKFSNYSEGEQKAYIDWIYLAKSEENKALRIIKMMDRIQQGLKFYD